MVITVTVPDEFAAEAEARGLTTEQYVEAMVAGKPAASATEKSAAQRMADLERFFDEISSVSHKIPHLPEEAFTRESFYQDHD